MWRAALLWASRQMQTDDSDPEMRNMAALQWKLPQGLSQKVTECITDCLLTLWLYECCCSVLGVVFCLVVVSFSWLGLFVQKKESLNVTTHSEVLDSDAPALFHQFVFDSFCLKVTASTHTKQLLKDICLLKTRVSRSLLADVLCVNSPSNSASLCLSTDGVIPINDSYGCRCVYVGVSWNPGIRFTKQVQWKLWVCSPWNQRNSGFSVSQRKVSQIWERGITPACFAKRGNLSSESVTMVTESVKLTWSFAGFLQQTSSLSLFPLSNVVSFPHSFIQSIYYAHFSWVWTKILVGLNNLLVELYKIYFCVEHAMSFCRGFYRWRSRFSAQGLTHRQRQKMILRLDVLSFPDEEQLPYHFSLQSVIHLNNLIHPLITSIAQILI